MNDREEWRERVGDIRAGGTTWWWWWYIYKSMFDFIIFCQYNFIKILSSFLISACPVGWGCKIHREHLCRGVKPPANKCPRYVTKQSDGEALLMLKVWRMRSASSLPSLPGSLWPRAVEPDWVQSMGWIEVNCVLMLHWITWNRNIFWRFNCGLIQNWIVGNETVFVCETEFGLLK